MKFENPCACAMMNCNVFVCVCVWISVSTVLPVVQSCECIRCNKSNHLIQTSCCKSHLQVKISWRNIMKFRYVGTALRHKKRIMKLSPQSFIWHWVQPIRIPVSVTTHIQGQKSLQVNKRYLTFFIRVWDLSFHRTGKWKELLQIGTSTISGPVVNQLFMIDLRVKWLSLLVSLFYNFDSTRSSSH
jgi:hypothetical protein